MAISNGNGSYVLARLEQCGIQRLTKEEETRLSADKENYEARVAEASLDISHHKREIRRLEKELNDNRPGLPSAKYIHGGNRGCGLKSVYTIGKDPQDHNVYFCGYCDADFQIGEDSEHEVSDGEKSLSELAAN